MIELKELEAITLMNNFILIKTLFVKFNFNNFIELKLTN